MKRPPPTWRPIALRCNCGTQWDDWQPLNVPLKTWIAHVKLFHCPECYAGYRSIYLSRADALGER